MILKVPSSPDDSVILCDKLAAAVALQTRHVSYVYVTTDRMKVSTHGKPVALVGSTRLRPARLQLKYSLTCKRTEFRGSVVFDLCHSLRCQSCVPSSCASPMSPAILERILSSPLSGVSHSSISRAMQCVPAAVNCFYSITLAVGRQAICYAHPCCGNQLICPRRAPVWNIRGPSSHPSAGLVPSNLDWGCI